VKAFPETQDNFIPPRWILGSVVRITQLLFIYLFFIGSSVARYLSNAEITLVSPKCNNQFGSFCLRQQFPTTQPTPPGAHLSKLFFAESKRHRLQTGRMSRLYEVILQENRETHPCEKWVHSGLNHLIPQFRPAFLSYPSST